MSIDVEIDLSPGLFSLSIIGLADKAIDESRHHIVAAIKNSGAHNVILSGSPGSGPNVQRQSLHIWCYNAGNIIK